MTDSDIIIELMKEGIDENYAATILENVRNDQHDKKEYKKHIFIGSFFATGGMLITYLSYKFAEDSGGGMFLVAWGVVVLGIVTLIRGFILFRK